ncbi:MAG: hypothetical protein ABIA04_08605 [Pseudomonadota bacterium]
MNIEALKDLIESAKKTTWHKSIKFDERFLLSYLENHPQVKSLETYLVKNGLPRIRLEFNDNSIGYVDMLIHNGSIITEYEAMISPLSSEDLNIEI